MAHLPQPGLYILQTIFEPQIAHLPKMCVCVCVFFFFRKTIKVIFMYPLVPFIQQISKKSLQWIQSCDDVPFSGQNSLFAPDEIFFRKTINISSMYLLASFIVKRF